MKKVFKLAAIAAIACFTVVACNHNQPKVEDTTTTDTTVMETEDELICDPIEDVEETPVAEEESAATQAKKPSKNTSTKKEAKPTFNKNEGGVPQTTEEKIQQKVDNLKNDGNTTAKDAPIKGRRK